MPPRQPLESCLPVVWARLRQHLADLQQGQIPLTSLLVSQTLSRELTAYRVPSPAARAAGQLALAGKQLRPGQRVRFLYTREATGVYAWDLPGTPLAATATAVDVARYTGLLLRAVGTVLSPLGIEGTEIWQQVHGWGQQLPLPLPGLAAHYGLQDRPTEPLWVRSK